MMAVPLGVEDVQATLALSLPRVAIAVAGAEGGPAGITATEAGEDGDVPSAFLAFTLNV